MKIRYPDYSRSLLSLASSVQAYFGADAPHNTLAELDAELAKGYKNVAVMLFDGMGTAILKRRLPEDAFLRRNLRAVISSVFPPTTTAATVAVESGLSPVEHGWLGWSLYFVEIGANVNIFPNMLSGSSGTPAADFHVARRYMPYTGIVDKINAAGRARAHVVSPFHHGCGSESRIDSVRGACDAVERLCAEGGRKYIYSYWPQPDSDMHEFGTVHPRITEHLEDIDAELERLCGRLSDTLVVVTADHGMADVEYRFLPEYPDVMDCLERTPWMEQRAMAFAVKPGRRCEFERAFERAFGDCYILFSRERVLELGLFGLGEPHPRSAGFMGDYIAAATGGVALEVRERTGDVLRAAHAGLTADEMEVPLIFIGRK